MAAFWTDCYQAHFQRFFNKPFDVQIYHDRNGFALKVATYDRAMRNSRVLASMGLADKIVANNEEDFVEVIRDTDIADPAVARRLVTNDNAEFGEVILHADVADPAVPHLFVNALFFILQHDIELGSRFAIGGLERMHTAFSRRYGKSALYFALAHDENENFNKVRNGDEFGFVYQAFFISPAENRYLDDHGPDEFEKKVQAQEGDRNSIRRSSVV